MKQILDVDHVKNSSFLYDEDHNTYVCLHYNTEILKVHDRTIRNLYVPSPTSTKMAKRCLAYIFGNQWLEENWLRVKNSKSFPIFVEDLRG